VFHETQRGDVSAAEMQSLRVLPASTSSINGIDTAFSTGSIGNKVDLGTAHGATVVPFIHTRHPYASFGANSFS
jgi:hypothetical protein